MYSLEIQRRFWDNVRFWGAGIDDCWPYGKKPTGLGYGQLLWKGSPERLAHRLAYKLTYGEPPEGFVIDHECHNRDQTCPGGKECMHRRCCNPRHLVAKTIGQNVQAVRAERRKIKTHCVNNHEWNDQNTRTLWNGNRQCRTCAREKTAFRRATEGRRDYE